ncbi:hypothetical protein [Halovivax limisalsi]|uniref:hypothetical protein n=1 Tax=Halovivax limisalsi TaxID=1453760 RepID=UPI001FFCB941|nr:hypothetical protein [Halovivax limisalsi]
MRVRERTVLSGVRGVHPRDRLGDLYRLQVDAGEPTRRGPYIEYLSVVAMQIVDGELGL